MGVHWYRGHTEKSESNEEAERETEAYIIHRRKCMGIGRENIPSRRISRRRGAHVYVIQQWILATPIMEAVLDLFLEIYGKHPNFRERDRWISAGPRVRNDRMARRLDWTACDWCHVSTGLQSVYDCVCESVTTILFSLFFRFSLERTRVNLRQSMPLTSLFYVLYLCSACNERTGYLEVIRSKLRLQEW